MVALPHWLARLPLFGTSRTPADNRNAYRFVRKLHRKNKGATPALKELMRDYHAKKRSGEVIIVHRHSGD